VSRTGSIILLATILGGCSGIDLSPINPTGIDFGGEWVIDFGDSDQVPDLRNHRPQQKRRSVQPSVRREAMRIGDGSGFAFIAQDFQVLRADKLLIEQNPDSMGIRYSPGVYRDVTWGERQRGLWEVNAGWEEDNLVIVSEANNLKVIERFQRASSGQLIILVSIEADGEEMDFNRTFNRRN
jgi:hypothetical protein